MRELIFTSSILILAVALLRLALGRHIPARARYALWLVVLLRLAIPLSPIESGASAAALLARIESVPAPAAPAAPGQTAAAANTAAVMQIGGAPAAPDAPHAPNAAALPAGALYLVWAVGSLAAGGWMLAENLRFARRLRAKRTPPTLPNGWDGPETACPLPVWQCAQLTSPCLFGVLRPAIYLNDAACQSPEALVWAVRHERQHYLHKDHIWCLTRCVCLAVYWWHPLVWLAAALSRRDCELACDEGVTAALGPEARLAYGRCLLALAPARGVLRPLAATGMSEGAKQLKARLTAIGSAHKTAVWAAVLAVIAAAVLAVTTLTRAPALPRNAQAALNQLQSSIAVRDGMLGFTLPETGFDANEWSIHISGTARMGEGQQSLHFLEEQQEQGWQGGVWYAIADEASLYDRITELWLDASLPGDGDGPSESVTVNLLEAAETAQSRQAAALAAALPEGEEVWVDYRLNEAYSLVYSYITAGGLPNNEDAVQGHVYLVPADGEGAERIDPLVENKGQLLDELAEGEGYFLWPPVWLEEGQRVLFGWQQTAGTTLTTRLWTIENGAAKELDCPPEQLFWQDGNEFTGTCSAWDAIEDADGGTGHTQKLYWLYWDEEAGALREYAGEEITEEELLRIARLGSSGENDRLVRQVLDAIQAEGGVLGSIWLRGNGVINLNYRVPVGEGDAWANHNLSFACDANRNLSLFNFKDASPGGLASELLAGCDQGGVYEAAAWPEIAAHGRTVIGLAGSGAAG